VLTRNPGVATVEVNGTHWNTTKCNDEVTSSNIFTLGQFYTPQQTLQESRASPGRTCDAAVNFDAYRILQRHWPPL